jgi:hypothetical protein
MEGSGGPNAAGRAGKKVLLSSVRLMAAFGGKRVNGALKEKKDRSDDFGGVRGAAAELDRRIELIERQKRKREAEKKSTRMATRGGRIVDQRRALWDGF